MKFLKKIYRELLEFIWPRFCTNCKKKLFTEENLFCEDCNNRINHVHRPFCTICGDPVDGEVDKNYICHYCTSKRPNFKLARSAIRFDNIAKTAIYELKYNKETYTGKYLADFTTETIREEYKDIIFDYITFIPLHKKRLIQRTFNQSKIIARYISKEFHIPLASDLLIRTKETNTQTLLNFKERQQNINGAFKATNISKFQDKTILIVDDVMTTGATVNECSKVLKKAGALDVYVITVARG